MTLLQYWQEAALRERISNPHFDLTQTISLNAQALKSGQTHIKGNKEVLIAPWWAQKKEASQSFAPLWIPADLIDGQLHPSKRCPLPWLCTHNPIFESLEQYDKALLDHFFDAQGELIKHTQWEMYVEASLSLFKNLLKPDLKAILDKEYDFYQDKGWMIENKPSDASSPLLSRYASLEEVDFEALSNPLKVIDLQVGQIQALHTPFGSEKNPFIKTLLTGLWSKALIENKAPVIVWTGLQKPSFECILDKKTSVPSQEEIEKIAQVVRQGNHLWKEVLDLNQHLRAQFSHADSIEEVLERYQNEDQNLEIEFERCVQRYSEWQKQSGSGWKKWLPQAKKRQQKLAQSFFEAYVENTNNEPEVDCEQLMLDKIRKIKVARTKIHNELVDVSQFLASKNGVQNRYLEWVKQNIPQEVLVNKHTLEEKQACIEHYFSDRLFKLACAHFKIQSAQDLVNLISLEESSRISEIDYLIVDNAHTILPSHILELLSKSKKALFLADEQGLPIEIMMSPVYDRTLLKTYELATTEESLEDLFYQGIHASASAFCVAKVVSVFQTLQEDGITSVCDLSLKAKASSMPTLEYVHINGDHEAFDLSYKNEQEAEVIVDYLQANSHLDRAIITLFEGQKVYLTQRLAQLKIECPVLLLNEIYTLSKKQIIFSPSYTCIHLKPYPLDQKEALLKLVLRYAQESVLIVADMGIFNPHTHTPSGQMAKLLFNSSENRLLVKPSQGVDKVIKGLKAHQDSLESALKQAKKTLTIVSSQLAEKGLTQLLEKFNLKTKVSDFECRLFISDAPVAGVSWKSASVLNLLNQLCEQSVKVFMVAGLHTNACWSDNTLLIEGTQPWLALEASDKLSSCIYNATDSSKKVIILNQYLENQTLRQLSVAQVVEA